MLTVKGRVENGAVLPLEPISDSYEGREVTITLPDESPTKNKGGIREMFGSVSLGHPTGSDNESIDADLGREYGSTHEDE